VCERERERDGGAEKRLKAVSCGDSGRAGGLRLLRGLREESADGNQEQQGNA